MRRTVLITLLAAVLAAPPVLERVGLASGRDEGPAPSVINFIGHETSREMTRVIFHASGPIDYRGGTLRGNQVILDIANVETSLPTPVVELGAPEVDRVVIGPEISKDGVRLLKVRLTGVRARSHRVQVKDNELHIDLTPLKRSRDGEKGLPKMIHNGSEVTARKDPTGAKPAITWAVTAPAKSGTIVTVRGSRVLDE